MDREKAIKNGLENSLNETFTNVCSKLLLSSQLTIPDRRCKPAESGISISDNLTRRAIERIGSREATVALPPRRVDNPRRANDRARARKPAPASR